MVQSSDGRVDGQYQSQLSMRVSTNKRRYDAWIVRQCWEDNFLRRYFVTLGNGGERISGSCMATELSAELSSWLGKRATTKHWVRRNMGSRCQLVVDGYSLHGSGRYGLSFHTFPDLSSTT